MNKDDPQFRLRITPDIKEIIERSAERNRRSLNAEIVYRLKRAYELEPIKAIDNKHNALGSLLVAARKQMKLTQQQVADTLGVSRVAVGQWESGTTTPATSNLLRVCQLLDLNIESALKEASMAV